MTITPSTVAAAPLTATEGPRHVGALGDTARI